MATEVKDEAAPATNPVTGEPLTDREKFLVEKFQDFQRMCLDFFKTKGIQPSEAISMVSAFDDKIQKIVLKKLAEKMVEMLDKGDVQMGVALVNTQTGEVLPVLGDKPPDEVVAKVMAEARTAKAAEGVKTGNC